MKMQARFVMVPFLMPSDPTVVVRTGVLWIDLNGLGEIGNRLVVPSLFGPGISPVVVRQSVVPIDFNRSCELGDPVIVESRGDQFVAQIVVKRRLIGRFPVRLHTTSRRATIATTIQSRLRRCVATLVTATLSSLGLA